MYRGGIPILKENDIINAIKELTKNSKGQVRSFTLKQIARTLGIRDTPVNLSIIRYYLDQLVNEGLIEIYEPDKKRNRRYFVRRGSKLWY